MLGEDGRDPLMVALLEDRWKERPALAGQASGGRVRRPLVAPRSRVGSGYSLAAGSWHEIA